MTWHIEGKPYDVQTAALEAAQGQTHWAHFLEQGLGKTAITLNEFMEYDDVNFMLVLCPNSKKSDWVDDAKEWAGLEFEAWPDISVGYEGDGLALNYETLISRGMDHMKTLMKMHRVMLVLDESSFIKNPQSKRTKAALLLAKKAVRVRILNGTPMTQSVMDLWPQLRIVGAINGVNPYAFRNRFATMGGYMGKQVTGVRNEAELHQLLGKHSFRALKTDWTDLPDKIYTHRRVEMVGEQKKAYHDMLQESRVIRGQMSVEEIKEAKRAFNEDPECRVLILQIQAGSFGHTLLGGKGANRCATTIYFENSYSLLNRAQIEDRNHRYGQDQSPVHVDIACSGIDVKIIKSLQSKKSIASAIVDAVKSGRR
jgi:SNF2 family DNA or RNA helicase